MKILVTGAYGYIGSSLVSSLCAAGHQVGLIVRRQPSFESAWTAGLEMMVWDMTVSSREALRTHYDMLIHAAGANDVDSANPREALLGTTLTTCNAIEYCQRNDISRFIYLSTFQVYGATDGQVGDDSTPQCLSDYALTHWAAEEYLRAARRNGILDYVIVRPTNVYGAPLDKRVNRWTLVPACFCKAAFDSGKIVLRSSGNQYRNFVHLDAIVDTIMFLANNFDRAKGQACNVAGTEAMSIREVADIAIAVYENIFHRQCELVVESDEPRVASPLLVATDNLDELGFRSLPVPTVSDEINTIFKLLRG